MSASSLAASVAPLQRARAVRFPMMPCSRSLRRAATVAMLAVGGTLAACAGRLEPATGVNETSETAANERGDDRITVVAQNRGFFDVAVYAVRSSAVIGARVATVSAGSTAQIRVRPIDLQPGNRLVLQLRSIGSRYAWTSSALPVSEGTVARLDIQTTGNGDLSQSSLFSQVALTDSPAPVAPVKPDTAR